MNLRSNSADILRWDMGVMFARSYVLQLSDNIKRSKEQSARNGIWMGLAPVGYIHTVDEKGEKTIVPDPEIAPFIDEVMYLEKVKEYKTRQSEIIDEMKRHEVADQNFHITANMVLKLAAKARELFGSSEVDEKRQLLNLVFQNLQLRDLSLSVQVHEPFKMMMDFKDCPTNWWWRDAFRTFNWTILE